MGVIQSSTGQLVNVPFLGGTKTVTKSNMSNTAPQIVTMNSQGVPAIQMTPEEYAAKYGATMLPEVEITATPLTAFGFDIKPMHLIIGAVALGALYYAYKKGMFK